jgi:Mrp family chromosome partitioning ATPase/capsular polysaccharide biosynthesis protein
MDAFGGQTHSSAAGAVRVLRRNWWLIALSTIVVTGAAIALSLREDDLFQSSSQVLLKYENLASGLTGISDLSGVYQDPARIAETQTQIAMSPSVARRVADARPWPGLTQDDALGAISVTASPSSDTLDFETTWSDADGAAALATEYARQYVRYRQQLDAAAIVAAREELQGRIEELRAEGPGNGKLIESLVEDEQRLRTMQALQTANATVLREASGAAQIQPRPKRAAALGIVLGLMLGVALAFGRKALDTRITSATEIGERLDLPLLARVPEPPRRYRSAKRLVMLSDRTGTDAEAFRILRTNLDFVNMDRGARSIMITSAVEEEGKSTTVSNLAIALTRAGRRVALVDLDLRRPSLATFFGLPKDTPGLTTVLLGRESLRNAMRPVLGGPLDFGQPAARNGSENGQATPNGNPVEGSLSLLVAGPTPPDPGEFIATAHIGELLRRLADDYDVVLVDTPPLLSVGDAMVLSGSVDAAVVVARLGVVRRPTLEELRRALATCPTVKLGYVATGAQSEDGYGYGSYDYAYGDRPRHRAEEQTLV